jgi:predicted Zn-dependent protease
VVSLKYDHAAALQTLGRNREAVDLANDLAKQRPRWARVYEVLGKAYAGVGNRTQQHRALAEFYYLQGGLASAIEQLRLAQSAGDGDFYTLSVVDVRLREMRAQQAQEAKEKKQQ